MIPWKWLIGLDAITMFIITTGGSVISMMVESESKSIPSWGGLLVALLGGLVAISQQLRARLAIPPPSAAMVATAVAAIAPLAAQKAAEEAAPGLAIVAKKAAEDAAPVAVAAAVETIRAEERARTGTGGGA